MFSIQDYTEAVSVSLQKHSEDVISELKQIFQLPFLPEVEKIAFRLFKEPMAFELTIMYYALDADGNERYYDEMGDKYAGGSEEVAEEIPYFQLPDTATDAFEAFRELQEDAVEKADEQVMIAWFADCYKRAGGDAFPLEASVGFHNDMKAYFLKQGAWAEDRH
ncbi:hypothetical protein SAMN04489762_2892 [Terribacillus saccharophilus]|uniref:Uncharacterized protein n=1 Tax=Terribacillus saccharophilus TaxID=361277 RepID=A0AAX2EI99_9BACI|nr:hypothetical protein SAMN04489762_2892 [Terribacillus saccharophilus]